MALRAGLEGALPELMLFVPLVRVVTHRAGDAQTVILPAARAELLHGQMLLTLLRRQEGRAGVTLQAVVAEVGPFDHFREAGGVSHGLELLTLTSGAVTRGAALVGRLRRYVGRVATGHHVPGAVTVAALAADTQRDEGLGLGYITSGVTLGAVVAPATDAVVLPHALLLVPRLGHKVVPVFLLVQVPLLGHDAQDQVHVREVEVRVGIPVTPDNGPGIPRVLDHLGVEGRLPLVVGRAVALLTGIRAQSVVGQPGQDLVGLLGRLYPGQDSCSLRPGEGGGRPEGSTVPLHDAPLDGHSDVRSEGRVDLTGIAELSQEALDLSVGDLLLGLRGEPEGPHGVHGGLLPGHGLIGFIQPVSLRADDPGAEEGLDHLVVPGALGHVVKGRLEGIYLGEPQYPGQEGGELRLGHLLLYAEGPIGQALYNTLLSEGLHHVPAPVPHEVREHSIPLVRHSLLSRGRGLFDRSGSSRLAGRVGRVGPGGQLITVAHSVLVGVQALDGREITCRLKI